LQLNNLLNQGQTGAAPPIDEVRRHLSDLQRGLGNLDRPFSTAEVQMLIKRAGQGAPGDYLAMQALLESARLNAKDRVALWKAYQELGRQLVEKPLQVGVTESDRASRRAPLALGTLKLAGFARAEQVEKKELTEASRSNQLTAWEPLAERIRVAWTVDVPDEFRKTKELALRDRISRLLPPFDRLPASDPYENPAGQLARLAQKAFHQWLADYYDSISKKLGDVPAAGFYAESAAEYRRFAQ